MKNNTSIIYAVGVLGTLFLMYIFWNIDFSNTTTEVKNIDDVVIDNNSFVKRKLSENEYWGKMLFKSKCLSCHKIYSSDNFPDIKKEIHKYSADTLFFNYLTVIKSTEQDSRSIPFPDLDILQTTAIKEYINALNE